MLRFLMWRLVGLLALLVGGASILWLSGGGAGRVLRGAAHGGQLRFSPAAFVAFLSGLASSIWHWAPAAGVHPTRMLLGVMAALAVIILSARTRARSRRRYSRFRVAAYRGDHAEPEAVLAMLAALHKRLLRRWWRRLLSGQPSLSLEVHHSTREGTPSAWLALSCPADSEQLIETALQGAYPNVRLDAADESVGVPPTVLRLKKHLLFTQRLRTLDPRATELQPAIDRLLTVLHACGQPAFVQLAATPAPPSFETLAKHLFKRREARLSRERREHLFVRDRSMLQDAELRGGLEIQHKPLFFADLRVIALTRATCEQIASQLRVDSAENRLVERGTAIRHGWLGLYSRRVQRGEGNPLPSFAKGVFAANELAAMWQLPSTDYSVVPFARTGVPRAPAGPAIFRPADGRGTLRDALGAVSIHPELRKQNTAVPGTVEQGKTSYLVASIAEDLARRRCAVIVLDPKGDAAEAAVSLVSAERTCTLLDLARPTCGFNPMAVDAPADVIADYVVAALKNLFTDADIRASSDRYLRNAIIAVLAYDRSSTLWDAARLLSVGEEGYSYRSAVGSRVRTLPEFKEISEFFTAELSAQLADARSTTTAKLDAPVNKLARLLNSPSIKRVLLNDSLRVDFDRVIAGQEVLVVKGALGAMGAGNTSVLMQLLVGMLDASLARQQDMVTQEQRVAVALKIDEAPLVLNRGFTETMALKRSAGLETVACWQTDAQWVDRDVREQLDALFAHRVYFATASVRDARASVGLTMAEFSDAIRPGIRRLSSLGHPDVRLHLPKHRAIASWVTAEGRQAPFIAETIPVGVDRERLALHASRQLERGGAHMTDVRQPHWQRARPQVGHPADGPASNGAGSGPKRDHRVARSGAPSGTQGTVREALPATPAESYGELVDLDRAQSVRWAKPAQSPSVIKLDPLDREILRTLASLRHVLSSQVHRRFNAGRAVSTTQRRMKRLSDAGLVARFQFHRKDGGGAPMCYLLTPAGRSALGLEDRDAPPLGARGRTRSALTGTAPELTGLLRQARQDVHVAGWTLAFLGIHRDWSLRGAQEAVLHPPGRSHGEALVPLTLAELRMPDGRVAHDFLRTDGSGRRVEVERFESIRPDAILQGSGIDLLVELDDRLPGPGSAAKLERYDHFLAGWSVHTARYGRRMDAVPTVVFLCRSRARARDCARAADQLLCACRAYAGEYPFDWEYPGRDGILFAAERDMHERSLAAYGVPRLPPAIRVAVAHGDPLAGQSTAEACEIPTVAGANQPPSGAPGLAR